MRKIVCAALGLLVLLSSGGVFAKGDQQVTICHQGKSITVAASGVRAHLQHGDTEGECAVSHEKLYRYRYYPSVAVYYQEERNLYFYQVNGVWQAGATLPDGIVLNAAGMVEIGLATDTPYTQHAQVSQQFLAPLPPTPAVTYKYLYYANSGVYYNVTLKQYFYQVNGVWESGATLPESVQLIDAQGLELELDTDLPYTKYPANVPSDVAAGEQTMTTTTTTTDTTTSTYTYRYYTSSGVYYNAAQQQYFYQLNGVWQAGARLPESILLIEEDAVEIELDTDAPYLQHYLIEQEYSGEVEEKVSEGASEGGQRDDQKVRLCHKGKVISVPQAAVAAHVKHGDTVGACPPAQKKPTPTKAQKKDKHEQKKDKKSKNK